MNATQQDSFAIETDTEGYLSNFEDWNEEVACLLAKKEGVPGDCPMSREALDILAYMRRYFEEFNSFPVLLAVCRRVDQPRGCVCDQFPDPLVAWKLAGLPKPSAGVVSHLRRPVGLQGS